MIELDRNPLDLINQSLRQRVYSNNLSIFVVTSCSFHINNTSLLLNEYFSRVKIDWGARTVFKVDNITRVAELRKKLSVKNYFFNSF